MTCQKFRRLPSLLIELRRAAGLSQKQLALGLGVKQTHLCALERGRRGHAGPELLQRLTKELGLTDDQAGRLRSAAAHDQLMVEVERTVYARACDGVSALLQAVDVMSDQELAGLTSFIHRFVASGRDMRALATPLPPATRQPKKEETA